MIDLRREERIQKLSRELETDWETDGRWNGVERAYTAEDVIRLSGSFAVDHTLARRGAERLWELLQDDE